MTDKITQASRTPGQPCDCCILLRDGEVLTSVFGDRPCSDVSRIELCAKHAAVDDLVAALREAQEALDVLAEDAAEAGYQARADSATDLAMRCRAALKRATDTTGD